MWWWTIRSNDHPELMLGVVDGVFTWVDREERALRFHDRTSSDAASDAILKLLPELFGYKKGEI